MSQLHDTTADRGPAMLVEGTYGVPYYRAADFPEPVPIARLTTRQRTCLARDVAEWVGAVLIAARMLQDELETAEEATV